MKLVQSYLDSLNALLKAGESFQKAYTELVPVYNKMSIKEQVEVRNSVATLVRGSLWSCATPDVARCEQGLLRL